MENILINTNDGIKHIDQIQFGVLSSADIAKMACVELVNRGLYNENKEPIAYGPLDNKLGVNEKGKICETCLKKIADCPGHFGYIRLEIPIFHIGYFKYIINILQCICKDCSRVLLPKEEKEIFRKSLRRKNLSTIARDKIFKNIIIACKKVKKCGHCDVYNGIVKHSQGTDATLIIHDRYNQKLNSDVFEQFKQKFESAAVYNKDIENIFNNKLYEELSSLKVFNLFNKIPKDEIFFFDMNHNFSNPMDLLVQYVIVPPLSIRPTVQVGFGTTNEDDLTIKIGEMIQLNKLIRNNLQEGQNTVKLFEDLSLLQHTHAQYINSDTKGLNKNILGSKPIRSLCTRLKGKNGRFRGNLSGKRVDFSGRTVISPDPNLKIDQVGVPVLIAKVMTYPQKVFAHNMNEMRKFILNGPDIYPGANFVEQINGNKIFLQFTSRKRIAEDLKIGDTVERHLIDDDIILFNRQPSLHRQSIMAFRAKVLPWRTLRFNECNCTPFNADFDGDEMNLHLPQTEEAKAEALYLMGVKENLITPKNAEPLIAATQDFLTTFFLITQKDFFLDRSHFFMYLTYFNDANEKIEVPPPFILKPKELWSGKQLFSLLLRPNRKSRVIVNLEVKARNFSKQYKTDEFRCFNDGFVIIKNSELLTGNICKASIGSGSKAGIVFALIKDNNVHITAEVLSRIAKFSSRWIGNYGMSLGIRDVYPRQDLLEKKEDLVSICYKKCDEFIEQYNKGQIQLKAGMNSEQSLESILNKTLSDVRETIGSFLRTTLPKSNSPLIMAVCGSKGSDINLSQMIACLGQQIVSGQRIGDGFYNRTLPHFEPYSKYPAAKGFVKNSFYTGLNATEFFFHTIGGREGLVDTAVKTAETGYMQRRLVKALEDLTVQYDGTVTISTGEILQFTYGDDGIDPMNVDDDNRIINLNRLLLMTQSICPRKRNEKCLTISEIHNKVTELLNKYPELHKYSENDFAENKFVEDIKEFFQKNIIKKITDTKEFLVNSLYKSMDKKKHNQNANVLNTEIAKKNEFSFDFDVSKASNEAFIETFQNGIISITENQINEFFRILVKKYNKAKIVPGEAVGAVAAQSVGEPGTQMTLKTFHFAGVASMNITLGVPRIKEIINSTKTISTPVIYAELVDKKDLIAARIVKGRIETTKFSEILEYIKEVMSPKGCYLKLKLDKNVIENLRLEINMDEIKEAILTTKKLKIKEKHIFIENQSKMRIEPYDCTKENLYFTMQLIKKKLQNVIVSGIQTISRAVINKKESEKDGLQYNLAIEGSGLNEIMRIPGIDHKKCLSNNIMEVEKVLGIEAARSTIINEIKFTFSGHSIQVDNRHLQLLADLMTFKGMVLGFTRFGISKMKDSTLMHSSFEKTTDHLFDASFHSRNDIVSGVSECIIMGKMIPLGTGLFKTMYDTKSHNENLRILQEKKEKRMLGQTNGFKCIWDLPTLREKDNIVEEKLKRLAANADKSEITKKLEFSLIDLIN